ncbi:MAG: cytochrome D1 domain-containing protein [Gallionellaceae bacterium]|nr:cytochrome D1 domain-containing protein [Gallionellaceae bacterium]
MNRIFWALLLVGLAGTARAGDTPDPEKLYQTHCLSCHAPNRLGGMGPTLLPESLARLKKPEAVKTITEGLPATQMPPFGSILGTDEIKALAEWIYTPNRIPPKWDADDIVASRIVNRENLDLPARPVFKADPMNITLVVEGGDHHISVLDGDVMEPITRFATRYALHGGPKFSQDGRFVYWASRDGWITKYDLWNLKVVAEVRAGINTRNVAVSSDGKVVMVANYLPNTLVALAGRDLALVKVIPVVGKNGKPSRVSAVYDARPRGSFIAALKDIPEVWEIPYDGAPASSEQGPRLRDAAGREAGPARSAQVPAASSDHAPVRKDLVRNFQDKEAIPAPGPLPVRQIVLDDYLDDFFFDQDYVYLMGAARNGAKGQVIHLDSGRKIADLDLTGMPHLGSGITWDWQGPDGQMHPVMASPNLKEGLISVIDMKTWQTVKTIPTLGPGFFLRSHENSPYAWADVFSGPNKDIMQVIDKQSLEVVATLKPEPGKTSTHVEFDRYGKYALVSIWEMDGALVVYDARTLKEVKRLPMKRPVGKYNVWNKTRLSEGTSH